MTLVLDQKAKLGNKPGLHAFVIGVADYPYLPGAQGQPGNPSPTIDVFPGMDSLACTVPAAVGIAQWLIANQNELPVPLATLWLLLSQPNAAFPTAGAPTLANVQKDADEWREAAKVDREGYTLFYFAGHGAARSRGDVVMLLESFNKKGNPLLTEAIDSTTLFYGMAPSASRPDIARNQFFFVDACRATPAAFKKYESLQCSPCLDVEVSTLDDRQVGVFYGALDQGVANGVPGGPTAFGKALLEGLGGDAVTEVVDGKGGSSWQVTCVSIASTLRTKFLDFNRQYAGAQYFAPDKISMELALRYLPGPPPVDIDLHLDPTNAADVGELHIQDAGGKPVVPGLTPIPKPYKGRMPAGLYLVGCRFNSPASHNYKSKIVPSLARPPASTWRVPVT